ncbi:MAG: carboxylating nicotinate-nucleotide diphosphorylase, partial [Cyclobacteriaceae bacterium]
GEGILAGVELAERILHTVDSDLQIERRISDGAEVKHGDIVFVVKGSARSILSAERLLLNCMQRMSGIATHTHRLQQMISHTQARLMDTRKTTPNFRLPEKWAVAIGGGINHRYALYDMIMLKDNHIDFAGGIPQAIERANTYLSQLGKDLKIEIETRNLDEVRQVLETGKVDVIMLDNMRPETMREAVSLIGGKYKIEASGNINEQTIREVAECGVDYISVGALTHSSKSMDMSLKAF